MWLTHAIESGPVDSTEDLYLEIGRRIRKARRDSGLTQEALGDRTGLARTSITNIESGNQQLPLHVLWRVAEVLDVEPRSLVPERSFTIIGTKHGLPEDVPEMTRAALNRIVAKSVHAGRK
jgi:transcriptional regulator with XRE-family HTH domain